MKSRQISSFLVVSLLMLGVFGAPVSAHFTLGELTPDPPYRQNDFDPHVPGVIAYVWPGAGFYGTLGAGASLAPYPGYQSPYPRGNPPGLRTDFYQLESTYYAPFGAILTSTIKAATAFNRMKVSGNPTIETAGTWVDGADIPIEHAVKGDLIIAFNATLGYEGRFGGVTILIPPEFKGIARSKVVASWTNNYDMYFVENATMEDLIAPGWTGIRIDADSDFFPIAFTNAGEWYYVRINDVTAPTIAGRYFFKVFMGSVPDGKWELIDECPPQNWPVLLVKGEVDPGIIEGTIKYGGWTTEWYGKQAELPGRVRAVGVADDPYTGRTTGRPVEARAYFNNTAEGHYEIEGVAPGTYDIYASLAGYPEIKIASGVKVLKGQSAHIDGHVTPGVVIHGEVFSKCGLGDVDWHCGTYERLEWDQMQKIKIEIYRSKQDVEATMPASNWTKAISWSPTRRIVYEYYGGPQSTSPVQFAWPHDPANYPSGSTGHDPDGVGPEQEWVVRSTEVSFKFQFGDKGLYGAPAFWTGHIPQTFATWTDGVGPGTYHVRAWTHGYLQTLADGVTFSHVTFTVASIEWPGDVYIPFDLYLGSWIVKEFHLHSVPGSLEDNGFDLPGYSDDLYLYVDVKDSAGRLWGWAVRTISQFSIWDSGNDPDDIGTPKNELAGMGVNFVGVRGLLGRSLYWGSRTERLGTHYCHERSYGMPAGTYTVKGYAAGYLDQHPHQISIAVCGREVGFSNHLDRGAMFNITVYSVDWERPSVQKKWVWSWNSYDPSDPSYFVKVGELIYIMPYDANGKPLAGKHSDSIQYDLELRWGVPVLEQDYETDFASVKGYFGALALYSDTEWPGYYPLAFETGTYSFKVFTYGYVQKKAFSVYAWKGATADIPIKVHVGANVTFDIVFKRESILDHLRYDSAVRVRLFNDKGVLVGEALTSDYTKLYANKPNTDLDNAAQLNPISDASIPDVPTPSFINYVPSSTTRLRGLIAGLPALNHGGYNPVLNLVTGRPIGEVEFCHASPDPYFDMLWTGDPIPAPYGIDAAPNYMGGWYVEVDIVPWYRNEDIIGNPFELVHKTIYCPPPPGLLTGESPKYIPENHWGPYEQRYKVTIPGAHLGGEASVVFELDLRGLVTGNLYTYTHCGDWRTTSWITVLATATDGKQYPWYSFDGRYEMWLTPGTYSINVIEWSPANQGHNVITVPSYAVGEGSDLTMNFYLEQSGIPVPEFGTTALILSSALAASLFIMRRKRRR